MNSYTDKVKAINEKRESPPLAHVHNYGCQLNVTDGEKLKGILLKMGYGFTEQPEEADLVIFNTCAVRENAEERVFGNLGFLKHYKEKNREMIICVSGCMTEQSVIVEKIKESYRYVDIVFGTNAFDRFPQFVYEVLNGRKHFYDEQGPGNRIPEGTEQVRSSTFRASVPVMYGCNNFCTYCIVPYVRGRERSREPEVILDEVRGLVNKGYREIMLLGQNVNSYGNDLGGKINFPELLRRINAIEGEFIVRFMSSHPKDAGKELIDAIVECDKLGNYLHLPVQSGSNSVLERMNRRYTTEEFYRGVELLRKYYDNPAITTDVIVGFPGETPEEFEITRQYIEKIKFYELHVFKYSRRNEA